jgi:hypothetical protein
VIPMNKLILVALVLTAAVATGQTNYYLSTTGSDSNNGLAPATAWATFSHADASITVGSQGAVVNVAPGTYNPSGGAVTLKTSGVSDSARVKYVCTTPLQCKVNATFLMYTSFVDLQGFELPGNSGAAYCEAVAIYAGGANGPSRHDNRILNNYAHDFCPNTCASTGIITMEVCPGCSMNNVPSNNTVSGNRINNAGVNLATSCNQYHGIYPASTGDIIQDNIVSNVPGWGIHEWHQSSNSIVTNNTVFNNKQGGIIIGNDMNGSPSTNDYTTVNNNISVNNGSVGNNNGIEEFGSSCTAVGSHNVYQNNLAYGNSGANFALCGGKTPSGTQSGSNSATFVSYLSNGSGNYQLAAGSTAIGQGTTTCASGTATCVPSIDFAGQPRPVPPSIGAYEFSGSTAGSASPTGPAPPTGLAAVVQ